MALVSLTEDTKICSAYQWHVEVYLLVYVIVLSCNCFEAALYTPSIIFYHAHHILQIGLLSDRTLQLAGFYS